MIKQGKKRVIAYLHTHWDREWYRTKEEFNLRLLEVFDEIIDELEKGSMPCFYFDGQTCALEDYLKFRPEKFDTIKKLIKAEKLFVGPFFVSADNFLVNGISLIRNLNLGIEYSKSLGTSEFLGYLPDTFGHSKSIFIILKSFGISYALAWRGVGALSHNDFKMNGVNTTKLVFGYFMDVLHAISGFSPDSNEFLNGVNNLEKILDKIAQNSSDTLLLPVGADHLAALSGSLKLIDEVNKKLENYYIELTSPFEYVQNVDYSNFSMEGELLDNSETYILPGVYSSRIPQKAYNARLQWDLFRIVEPLNYFLSDITGAKYTQSLVFAAKEFIKNHAHDSIYGCSIDEVHKCVQARFDKVFQIVDGVKHRLVRDFRRSYSENIDLKKVLVNGKKTDANFSRLKIGALNLSNHKYSGPVRFIADFKMPNAQVVRTFKGFSDEILYDTRQIPVTEQYLPLYEQLIEVKDLPPFTFSPVECVKPISTLEISENKLANSLIELNLKRNGKKIVINFVDKRNGAKYNDVLKMLEYQDFGDSYNSACPNKPVEWALLGTKVISKGPIEACLRLIFEHNFRLDVKLSNCSEFFMFEAKFSNNKKNRKIQACFNLKNPIDATFAEDAIGYVMRKHDYNYNPTDYMPAKPKIEVKSNSYPMQRWLLVQNLGVITLGLNEYEIYKNELKITLSRGTGRISEPKNLARFVPAGPPIETSDLQNLGKLNLKFACALNPTIASIQRNAEVFYGSVVPILGDFKNARQKTYLNLPENLTFYGLKPAMDKVYGVFYNESEKNIIWKDKTILPKTINFIEL